jgi:hypothetical protein
MISAWQVMTKQGICNEQWSEPERSKPRNPPSTQGVRESMCVPRIILHYEILSRIAIYAALSNPRSEASSNATTPKNRITATRLAPECTVHIRITAPCPLRGACRSRRENATTVPRILRASPNRYGQQARSGLSCRYKISMADSFDIQPGA